MRRQILSRRSASPARVALQERHPLDIILWSKTFLHRFTTQFQNIIPIAALTGKASFFEVITPVVRGFGTKHNGRRRMRRFIHKHMLDFRIRTDQANRITVCRRKLRLKSIDHMNAGVGI